MKVQIHSIKGGVTVESMPDDNVAELLEAFKSGEPVLTIALDGGAAVSHVLRANIARIDVLPEGSDA